MLSPRLTAASLTAASLVAGLGLARASSVSQDAPLWPTDAWTTSSPESVGLDAASFAALDRDIRQGVFGNVDRVLVIKGGRLVVDEAHERDYREISRGASGPLGCGEGCTNPAAMHDFNYYHPDFHPFYQGREVHSLQSVTTGRFIDDYATEFLFGPLGIEEFYWKKTPQGYPDTEGGLYLKAEDLAKIGYLYLHDGVWDGERILPAGWVEQATTRHARAIQGNWDYGLQWWLTTRNGLDVWAGRGFGGQFLYVIPERDIVGVINAWNIFGQRTRNIANSFLEALVK